MKRPLDAIETFCERLRRTELVGLFRASRTGRRGFRVRHRYGARLDARLRALRNSARRRRGHARRAARARAGVADPARRIAARDHGPAQRHRRRVPQPPGASFHSATAVPPRASCMDFEITHITDYGYQYAAAEAYLEARLTPPDLPTQTVKSRRLIIEPATKVSGYLDYYGNAVEFFSLPYRHRSLVITSKVEIQTRPPVRPEAALEVSIDEARQIVASAPADDFRLPPADGDRRADQGRARLGAAVSRGPPAVGRGARSVEPRGVPAVYLCQRFDDEFDAAADRLAAAQGRLPGFHPCHAQRAAARRAALALRVRLHRGRRPAERRREQRHRPRRAHAGGRDCHPCLGRGARARDGLGGARPDEPAMVRRAAHQGVARTRFPRRDAAARDVQGHGQAEHEGQGVRQTARRARVGAQTGAKDATCADKAA